MHDDGRGGNCHDHADDKSDVFGQEIKKPENGGPDGSYHAG